MDKKELRQGNLIFGLYENEDSEEIYKTECSFLGFNPFDNYIFVDSKSIGFDEFVGFEPITLTEEWLLNFGFEKKSWFTNGILIECIYYKLNDFVVYLLPNSFEIELITKSGEQFNLFKNWNYVHQLQNLYFSLIGEELTLKNVV